VEAEVDSIVLEAGGEGSMAKLDTLAVSCIWKHALSGLLTGLFFLVVGFARQREGGEEDAENVCNVSGLRFERAVSER
jgi:hypothetical protein